MAMATGAAPIVVACPATKADTPGYAVVIAHYLDPKTKTRSFFIGQESVYKAPAVGSSFRNVPAVHTTDAARIAYAKTSGDFVAGTNHIVIRLKPGTVDQYKFTIQELPADPFHGFPKGAGLNDAETSIAIAKREFQEETGYSLPRDPVYKKCIEYVSNRKTMVAVVFHYEIADAAEKTALETAFATKVGQDLGEVFNAAFKTANDINAQAFKINYISKAAFQTFDVDHGTNVDQTSIPKGGEKASPPLPSSTTSSSGVYVPPGRRGNPSASGTSSRAQGPTATNKFAAFRRPGGGARKRRTQRRTRRNRRQSRRTTKK